MEMVPKETTKRRFQRWKTITTKITNNRTKEYLFQIKKSMENTMKTNELIGSTILVIAIKIINKFDVILIKNH